VANCFLSDSNYMQCASAPCTGDHVFHNRSYIYYSTIIIIRLFHDVLTIFCLAELS